MPRWVVAWTWTQAGPTARKHPAHHPCHFVLVHPVEGLRERHQPEGAQIGRQFFGTHLMPLDVVDAGAVGRAAGLGDHVRVGVDPDCGLEEWRQQ